MNNEQQHTRGIQAQQLLDNELLQDALKAIEEEVIAQWESCPARDHEGKEQLWQLFKTSKKFRSLLLGYVESGKLATIKIEEEKKGLLTRMKRIV